MEIPKDIYRLFAFLLLIFTSVLLTSCKYNHDGHCYNYELRTVIQFDQQKLKISRIEYTDANVIDIVDSFYTYIKVSGFFNTKISLYDSNNKNYQFTCIRNYEEEIEPEKYYSESRSNFIPKNLKVLSGNFNYRITNPRKFEGKRGNNPSCIDNFLLIDTLIIQ